MLASAMLFWLVPPVLALLGVLGVIATSEWPLVATALSAGFWMLVSVGMGIPAPYGLGYPLGALVGLYIVLRSARRGARKVEWKGRVYDVRPGVP